MSGTASTSPAVVVLEAFTRWKPEAYVCCPDVGRWRADCPLCGRSRGVRISEHGDNGPVAMWCVPCGASQERICDALLAAIEPDEGDWRDARIAKLLRVVELQGEYIAMQDR